MSVIMKLRKKMKNSQSQSDFVQHLSLSRMQFQRVFSLTISRVVLICFSEAFDKKARKQGNRLIYKILYVALSLRLWI